MMMKYETSRKDYPLTPHVQRAHVRGIACYFPLNIRFADGYVKPDFFRKEKTK
jgi:hypothetical protein